MIFFAHPAFNSPNIFSHSQISVNPSKSLIVIFFMIFLQLFNRFTIITDCFFVFGIFICRFIYPFVIFIFCYFIKINITNNTCITLNINPDLQQNEIIIYFIVFSVKFSSLIIHFLFMCNKSSYFCPFSRSFKTILNSSSFVR